MPIMNDFYRQGGIGREAGISVTETKHTDKSINKSDGEYWHDVQNELSPVRRHLIHTYLQVQDDEALPLLGEYFGVALSFMALGALVRASNSSKKRRKGMSDEERLDLRACSRFQRMALESMLKEAMERLRGLAQNAYQMEERVRDLVEAEMEKDKEKVVLLSRVAEAEKAVHELKALRKAEGKANERVMSIVAAKEQDWLKEKRNLQKEVERLKENLNNVCREVKFQSRRCRSLTCEHCKGIDRVVRNVRGKASLRELNSRETSAHVSSRREVVKVEQPSEVKEVEEERVLVKALEQKKKRSERPGHLQVHDRVEKHEKHGNWTATRSSVNPSGGSAGGAGQFMTKELIAKQQQEMESELANILKRVGILKQKSHSTNVRTTEQQNKSQERKNITTSADPVIPLESRSLSVGVEPGNSFSDEAVSGLVMFAAVKEEQAPSNCSSLTGPQSELAVTTGLSSSEQEVLFSGEEDPDLLELEKAFDFEAATDTISNAFGEDNQQDTNSLAETATEETTEDALDLLELEKAVEFEAAADNISHASGEDNQQDKKSLDEAGTPETIEGACDLLELEKAFELEVATDNISNASRDANQQDTQSLAEAGSAETTEDAADLLELEKAFEFEAATDNISNADGEDYQQHTGSLAEVGTEETTEDAPGILELEKAFELEHVSDNISNASGGDNQQDTECLAEAGTAETSQDADDSLELEKAFESEAETDNISNTSGEVKQQDTESLPKAATEETTEDAPDRLELKKPFEFETATGNISNASGEDSQQDAVSLAEAGSEGTTEDARDLLELEKAFEFEAATDNTSGKDNQEDTESLAEAGTAEATETARDLLETEKAFEFETATANISNASGEGNQQPTNTLAEAGTAETTEDPQVV